jgi:hypothetical protein
MAITITYTLTEEDKKEIARLTEWIKEETDKMIFEMLIELVKQQDNE